MVALIRGLFLRWQRGRGTPGPGYYHVSPKMGQSNGSGPSDAS